MTQVLRAFRKAVIVGPIVLLATAIVVAGLAIWRSRRRPSGDAWATSVRDGLTILAIAGPLAITLVPSGRLGGRSLDLIPLRSAWRQVTNSVDSEAAAVQIGGNVLLFVPFGLLAPMRWPALANLPRILLATLAFGALLEGLQFAAGFGRVASVSDVLLYAVGGLLGYALFRASGDCGSDGAKRHTLGAVHRSPGIGPSRPERAWAPAERGTGSCCNPPARYAGAPAYRAGGG